MHRDGQGVKHTKTRRGESLSGKGASFSNTAEDWRVFTQRGRRL
nr:MAG TPA: hypothetical protein [Caudoviricetes sp.]